MAGSKQEAVPPLKPAKPALGEGEAYEYPYIFSASELIGKRALTSFIVPSMIAHKAITMIIGPPDSAKSWLAFDLAVKFARPHDAPTQWLGRDMEARGKVLLYTLDNSTGESARRLYGLGLRAGANLWAHCASEAKHTFTLPVWEREINLQVAKLRPGLIVVDSFRYFHSSDENDSKQMAGVLAVIKRLRTATGAAIVLVHHTGKDAARGGRGSSDILASADCEIHVAKEPLTATWTKVRLWQKDAETEAGVPFSVNGGSLTDPDAPIYLVRGPEAPSNAKTSGLKGGYGGNKKPKPNGSNGATKPHVIVGDFDG